MIFEDGTGKGFKAKIDDENRLHTFSVIEPEDKHINRSGGVWSLYFTVTPAGANDHFFYFKNTGTDDLGITDIRISSSVATEILYEQVSGTPTYVTGTDSDVTSRNLGNTNVPEAIMKFDTDITGLSSSGVIAFEECAAADTKYTTTMTSSVIVPQGQAVAFKRVAATGLITCVVSLVNLDA